ncbi:gamma-glutamylcyclotransferase family protein [Polyangium aurulentum]|uniref:gamma-glutamylcyclotransferase family protein n=1 Tax=Polyangium aurulentum TaxID=2567896 RepID=UPI0010AEA676|nr:gamma-glutamylcyclotransferase family protein [Polyangium aurulentum]UQA55763.1 gamma-glutamylcyclotransferase [Polyangium aurulentum]
MQKGLEGERRSGRHVLFVYGSLLAGEANHAMLTGARFLGDATTAPAFELADLGPYPALVRGGATAVAGELYAVTAEHLRRLDAFEGHPHLYQRGGVQIEGGRSAQSYFMDPVRAQGYPRIASGRWRDRAVISRWSYST